MFYDVTKIIVNGNSPINDLLFLKEALNFFRNLLVNYLPRLISLESFLKIIDLIFDEKNKFYNKLDPSLIEEINQATDAFDYQRIDQEQTWRQTLKSGDYIDAISCLETSQDKILSKIGGWCPAKITFADESSIQIKFIGRA